MPCPLFVPGAPLREFPAAGMPLGDAYGGHCASDPGALVPTDTLLGCCNHGYARGVCARAAAIEEDAARFLIRAHSGGVVEVAWSTERNHHPVAVGTLRLTSAAEPGTPIERQARAYAAGYLRRTGREL